MEDRCTKLKCRANTGLIDSNELISVTTQGLEPDHDPELYYAHYVHYAVWQPIHYINQCNLCGMLPLQSSEHANLRWGRRGLYKPMKGLLNLQMMLLGRKGFANKLMIN